MDFNDDNDRCYIPDPNQKIEYGFDMERIREAVKRDVERPNANNNGYYPTTPVAQSGYSPQQAQANYSCYAVPWR